MLESSIVMLSYIKSFLKRIGLSFHYRLIFAPYMYKVLRYYQNIRIKQIRKKPKIKVLFVVCEASTWKTEPLYHTMLKHPRFEPIIGISESMHVPGSKKILIKYLDDTGYEYIDLDSKGMSIRKLNPDIKFYYKPYELNYYHGLYFDYNLKSITCSINYGFNVSGGSEAYKHAIRTYAWREFVENEAVVEDMHNAGKDTRNKSITGLPLQDLLNINKSEYVDPWIDKDHRRKRIIYAPHHSFKGLNGSFIEYATFLEFGEYMLKMARKYASQIEWVFKPHPSLKAKLSDIWGLEKTETYYKEWDNMPNAQVKIGAYNDVFKYSDAMIHDCSSFIVEYQFTGNPVLFLEHSRMTAEQMFLSSYGYASYTAHYHAMKKEQIEAFIKQVINGEDPMKETRESFFKKYLMIPNGKTASDNIIDVILGYTE